MPASASSERGATAVEYALIAALIAVVVMVGVAVLGGNLLDSFTNTNDAVENAITGDTGPGDTLVNTNVFQEGTTGNGRGSENCSDQGQQQGGCGARARS